MAGDEHGVCGIWLAPRCRGICRHGRVPCQRPSKRGDSSAYCRYATSFFITTIYAFSVCRLFDLELLFWAWQLAECRCLLVRKICKPSLSSRTGLQIWELGLCVDSDMLPRISSANVTDSCRESSITHPPQCSFFNNMSIQTSALSFWYLYVVWAGQRMFLQSLALLLFICPWHCTQQHFCWLQSCTRSASFPA